MSVAAEPFDAVADSDTDTDADSGTVADSFSLRSSSIVLLMDGTLERSIRPNDPSLNGKGVSCAPLLILRKD